MYNEKNSGLESITYEGPNYKDVRINGTAFDKTGNLWITNSRIKNGLKVLKANGQWQSYATSSILNNAETTSYANIVIDRNIEKIVTCLLYVWLYLVSIEYLARDIVKKGL